jgi:hypothetical protein
MFTLCGVHAVFTLVHALFTLCAATPTHMPCCSHAHTLADTTRTCSASAKWMPFHCIVAVSQTAPHAAVWMTSHRALADQTAVAATAANYLLDLRLERRAEINSSRPSKPASSQASDDANSPTSISSCTGAGRFLRREKHAQVQTRTAR